jgi:hypothetical protein
MTCPTCDRLGHPCLAHQPVAPRVWPVETVMEYVGGHYWCGECGAVMVPCTRGHRCTSEECGAIAPHG